MRFHLYFSLLISLSGLVAAQSKGDSQEYFDEGSFFFTRGEYSEAAYYFRMLTTRNPDNSNFNFKLGECYMNIPGSEHLAIPCFEIATKRTIDKKSYRPRDFGEKFAPLHAWFYLGNTYRMAGRLNEALKAYDHFINSPDYYGNYNINIVENEIKSCERAKIIMDTPVNASIEPLDTIINTDASELYPVISSDEQSMVFIRRLKFYDAILWVKREGNSWSQPVNLNPMIGSDGEFYPVSLSHDGKTLFLMKSTGQNKDLYVAYRQDDNWTKAETLGKSVNTLADETWACISSDDKTLWFTSSRKGGQGGLDIYCSQRDKNNNWGKARNAGKIINTAFDEESPYLSNNDHVLFFSSKGHTGIGGFDIFYTVLKNKTWTKPVNIGYPVNTTTDNTGYVPFDGGKGGYYSFIDIKRTSSSEDVYRVLLKSNYPLP